MGKRKQPEVELTEAFAEYLKSKNSEVLDSNCRSKKYADIEYTKNGCLYRVEAKTHLSEDKNNAVHKLFGELLKMTGYEKSECQEIKYQVLLDGRKDEKGKDAFDFFSSIYSNIPKDKFLAFGKLVPVDKVIVFNCEQSVNKDNPKEFTWNEIVE